MSDRRKLETKIQKAIVESLEAMGLYVLRTNSGRIPAKRGWVHLQPKGTPDIHGATPLGRMFALEVKAPGEKPDADQLEKARRLKGRCILHAFVWTKDDAVTTVFGWLAAEREGRRPGVA